MCSGTQVSGGMQVSEEADTSERWIVTEADTSEQRSISKR